MKAPGQGRGEFLRFVAVGVLNTALTYLVYLGLARFIHYQFAYAIAYSAGVLFQFLLHSRFVFRVPLRGSNMLGYPPIHVLLYSFGALVLHVLVAGFGIDQRIAPLIVIALSVPLSFLLTRRWLVRDRADAQAAVRFADLGLALCIAVFATVFLVSSSSFIAHYSWRQLLFDQLLQYLPLLELDFPGSAVGMENGHRPLFPNLIRYADIVWGKADQTISIGAGLAFAFLSLTWLAVAASRQKALLFSERAAAILFSVLALFWLGNSRMLMHANEAIQVALTTLCVIAMGSFAYRAARANALAWMGLGALAAFVATFSFGSGIAAFPALVLLGISQRVPWRAMFLVAAVLVGTLVLYLFVLPGDEGVRESLSLRPLDSLLNAARWLSGPIVNGWLGLANPDAAPWLRDSVGSKGVGRGLVASADWLAARFGAGSFLPIASATIGLLGLAATGSLVVSRILRPRRLGLLEAQGLGLALFGAATGILIGVARLSYFDLHPAQIHADRYGVWPSLMWLGLALLLLLGVAERARNSWWRLAVPLLALIAGAIAWPSHLAFRGWGVAVYRNAERGAAAMTLGVRDPLYLPGHGVIELPVFERVVSALERRRVSVFADRSAAWIGKPVPLNVAPLPVPEIAAVMPEPVQLLAGERVVAFTGWIGEHKRDGIGELMVIDESRRVVGIARWSMDPRPVDLGLVVNPSWTGFDGYARVPANCESLTLVGLRAKDVQSLARFAPCSAPKRP